MDTEHAGPNLMFLLRRLHVSQMAGPAFDEGATLARLTIQSEFEAYSYENWNTVYKLELPFMRGVRKINGVWCISNESDVNLGFVGKSLEDCVEKGHKFLDDISKGLIEFPPPDFARYEQSGKRFVLALWKLGMGVELPDWW